ncbi:fructose-bisphosphate aldolase [Candidatus Woesearchaeota archaeon]|nr:fructose-bisphosphate aldolase [Candidatus Woesearchaeota archaeon]|tara:strand:- start:6434 stop:7558 length:1125 start_codon:yes stop_codon:yes gene_type:complete
MKMEPISGKKIFNALKNQDCIILACNSRIIPGVAKAVFKAAKDMDAALIMELARSECNQHVGYTGLTPETFSKYLLEANKDVGHDVWALHADHIGIKTGTREDIDDTKELIDAQIKAGYTSFAIDASHLFNFEGKTVEEELKPNIDVTIELGKYIMEKMGNNEFGLEVEVGEIGRKGAEGMVLTKPEEAVTYIKKLKEAGLDPDVIAIANGSTHGNIYDEQGNPIVQVSISIEQTKKVAKALRDAGFDVKIAQHGITGTPLELIKEKFPKGDIIKGNVATLFQNIVFDALKKYHPELYKEMFDWVIKNEPIEGKKPEEVFGKNGKYAVKVFFDRIYSMDEKCKKEIEAISYKEAKNFIDAFNGKDSASIVRKTM